MRHSRLVSALVAVVAVVMIGQPMFAQKAFLKRVKLMYPDLKKEIANCHLCHSYDKDKKEEAGKDNLNLFGKDLQAADKTKMYTNKKDGDEHKFTDDELAAIDAALKVVGAKDSNGNGKSNDDDLKAGVNPGVK